MGAAPVVQIADKFEHFLEVYRRPDGSRWGGQDLHDATGGVVTRSYVSNLRKGRIENPGFEKLKAIAKAMGFPPELWFEDVENLSESSGAHPSWFMDSEDNLALLDEELVEALRDETARRAVRSRPPLGAGEEDRARDREAVPGYGRLEVARA